MLALAISGVAHAQQAAESAQVAAVVVTGSRLATAGFQAPTPVTVLGAAQMAQRAPTTVYDITREIPSFRNSGGPTGNSYGQQAAGQAILDLRGLGGERTLILLDGRRHIGVNQNGTYDSNMVPVSMVDRTEIVTGGASAAYGSDAISGVVNFVLKKKMDGFSGYVQHGISQHGDNVEPAFSLAWGTGFNQDKGQFMVGVEYNENHGVGNMYQRAWGRKEPGQMASPAVRPAGVPSQIIENYVELSGYTFGGIINSGPLKGTAFGSGGTPYQFQYGPIVGSTEMYSPNQTNYGQIEYYNMMIQSPFERTAALAKFTYDITDTLKFSAHVDFGSLMTHATTITVRQPTNYIVQRDNPFLPAATLNAMIANNLQTVSVARQHQMDVGPLISGNHIQTKNFNSQLEGEIFDGWKWDVSGGIGKTFYVFDFSNTPNEPSMLASAYSVKGANGQAICGPAATNPMFNNQPAATKANWLANIRPGCVPYNFFGPNGNMDAVNYFNSHSHQDNFFTRYSAAFNISGDAAQLPAGPVSVAAGAEYRRDKANVVGNEDGRRGILVNQNASTYDADEYVYEGYVEIGAPLLKDVPLAKSLDLNGAVRRTNYSTSGAVITWKVGATYEPTDFLRLRVTRSLDIRAPNINELFNPGSGGAGNLVNRLTGAAGFVTTTTVGNPDLQPETGRTLTMGVVFQPHWGFTNGFRLAVDYFDIKIDDIIASVGAQDVLDRLLLQGQTQYEKFVVRSAGNVTGFAAVYGTPSNQNKLLTSGYDIEAAYRVPLENWDIPGALNIRALGTFTSDLTTIVYNGAVVSSDLDNAGVRVPDWSWNGNINYAREKLNVSLTARFTTGVKYSAVLKGPDDPDYNPASNNSINRNTWPKSLIYNTNISYDFISNEFRKLQGFVVINNLLDKDPPVVAMNIISGGNPYDVVGRTFKFGLRFGF